MEDLNIYTTKNGYTICTAKKDLIRRTVAEKIGGICEGYAADFCDDYDGKTSAYICDAFAEFADDHTSIYYSDIKKFICENFDAVEAVIDEFGWDGCGRDLYKAGQTAEFMQIERELYESEDDIKARLANDYIADYIPVYVVEGLDVDKLAEAVEQLSEALDGIDTGDKLSAIGEACEEFFEALRG